MKLNLLPSGSKKGGSPVLAWVLSGLFIVLSLIAAAAMAIISSGNLNAAREEAIALQGQAADAVRQAKYAQLIVDSTAGVARNIELEKAMSEHNTKYTRFYRQVSNYIPSFMRVNRMQVRAISDSACALTLQGVVYSLQQHHDAQLALLRIPGAVTVGATGYAARPVIVPALNEEDQIGRPSRIGSTPLPIDANERLNEIINRAQAGTQGFANVANFGADTEGFNPRGAMATGSVVTYTVLLSATGLPPAATGTPGQPPVGTPPVGTPPVGGAAGGAVLPPGWDYNFLVPNPAQTIQAAGGATGGAAAAGGAIPGAMPGGIGTIPATGAGAPRDGREQ